MRYADKIFINGRIITQNNNSATSFSVSGKEFLKVGSREECLKDSTADTEIIDLDGKTVLPGLIDGHTHPVTVAKTRWHVRMPLTHDKDELLSNIKEYVEKNPKKTCPYFYGESYFTDTFGEEGPTKELLDTVVSDRPARIQDFGDHACWYNTMALEMLGAMDGTGRIGSPIGKAIIKTDASGVPTGWVLEAGPEGDYGIYESLGWEPPQKATKEMVVPFLDSLKAHGVIGLFDGFTEGEESIKLFYEMDKAGELNMYYSGSVLLEDIDKVEESIKTAKEWQEKYKTEHIDIHTLKFFMDGTNEMGDCASLFPMGSSGDNYGHANATAEEMSDALRKLNDANVDLHVHVICDRAFRICVDAVEAAQKICGDAWRINITLAHCELTDFEDQKRAAKLGINIDWTCHWSGGYFGDAAIQYHGRERWETMYNFSNFTGAGGNLGFSSDLFSYQEATRGNPFFGMQIAMTRIEPWVPLDEKKYPGSERPSESGKLTLEQLLKGYTYNNAKRLRMNDKAGDIREGQKANFVILNKDPFSVSPEIFSSVDAESVYFEGKKSEAKDVLKADRS